MGVRFYWLTVVRHFTSLALVYRLPPGRLHQFPYNLNLPMRVSATARSAACLVSSEVSHRMARFLTFEERLFVCKTYYKCESASRVCTEFILKFPNTRPPSRQTVHKLVNKFETTGSVLNKKRHRTKTVLTEAKLDYIGAILEHSPQKSLKTLAQQTGMSVSSARKAKLLLHFECNAITPVHAPKESDSLLPMNYCSRSSESVDKVT